jgi:dTDP-glucose 4,6-dehydratase
MSWSGRRVLVTGAGGFIGSHLVERLVASGATTRAFVHYRGDGGAGWLDRSEVRDDVEIVSGDISDHDSMRQAVRGVDVVFHLAALIGIPYSYRATASYVRVNVEGTFNVLQACRDLGVGRVVHTSTSEVYGTAQYVPIDEAHPLRGQSPYSATKIGADKLAEAFHLSFGLPVVIVRPFNTFGPRQSARAVIPTVIAQALTGYVIRLGNTNTSRDFNFVSNTVDGFLLAGTSTAAVGATCNLGSGQEVTIAELARMVQQIVDRPVRIEKDEARVRPAFSEIERLVASYARAEQLLGWRPAVSFEDGLRATVQWIRENGLLYRPQVYAV